MKASEHEIRDMLQRRASEFSMAPDLPNGITRRARVQRSKTIVLAGAAVLAVATLGFLFASPARAPDQADRSAAGPVPRPVPTRAVRSVSYLLTDPANDRNAHPNAKDGPTVTLAALRAHARCMRAQGFDVRVAALREFLEDWAASQHAHPHPHPQAVLEVPLFSTS